MKFINSSLFGVLVGIFLSAPFTHWYTKRQTSQQVSVLYTSLLEIDRAALERFTKTNALTANLTRDDDILETYFLASYKLQNKKDVSVGSISFEWASGNSKSKVIDILYKIRNPDSKSIYFKSNLQYSKWEAPTNDYSISRSLDRFTDADYSVIYGSLFSSRGFGRITSKPVLGNNTSILLSANPQIHNYYFFVEGVNMFETLSQYTPSADPNTLYQIATTKTNSPQDYSFNDPVTTIEFGGLDPGATIDIFVLGKLAPGQKMSPRLRMEGNSGIAFLEQGGPLTLQMTNSRLIDQRRLTLTPVMIRAIVASNGVVFLWDPKHCPNVVGITAFRTEERAFGDFSDIGTNVFRGQFYSNYFEVEYTKVAVESSPSRNDKLYYFQRQPLTPERAFHDPKRPKAPGGLRQINVEEVDHVNYFIDYPPQFGDYTYTIYALDKSGFESYPIVVNCSFLQSSSNVVLRFSDR